MNETDGQLKLRRDRLHEQIADHLQDMIARNKLQPGDPLRSLRDLAEQMGVSRATVSEALRLLEQRGLVRVKAGSGAYVADKAGLAFIESMERLVVFRSCTWDELLTFRQMLEPAVAALAAKHATPENIAQMKEFLSQAEESWYKGDADAFVAADASFHRTLAQATRNELVIAVVAGIQKLLQSSIMRAQFHIPVPDENEGMLSHWPIYDAVVAGETERARTAMEEHLRHTDSKMRRFAKESSDW